MVNYSHIILFNIEAIFDYNYVSSVLKKIGYYVIFTSKLTRTNCILVSCVTNLP